MFARTEAGEKTTTFDQYMNWAPEKEWGKEAVLRTYSRPEERFVRENPLTEEDARMVRENLEQNVIAAAAENPEITFYCFFPPYSVAYWDSELAAKGDMGRQIEACAWRPPFFWRWTTSASSPLTTRRRLPAIWTITWMCSITRRQ